MMALALRCQYRQPDEVGVEEISIGGLVYRSERILACVAVHARVVRVELTEKGDQLVTELAKVTPTEMRKLAIVLNNVLLHHGLSSGEEATGDDALPDLPAHQQIEMAADADVIGDVVTGQP